MASWKNVLLVLTMGAILLLGISAIVAGPVKQQDLSKSTPIENPAIKEYSTLVGQIDNGQGLSDQEKLRYLELKEMFGEREMREKSFG